MAPAAKKRIPNLPSNVYHKETKIPTDFLDKKQTADFLREYEINNQHNKNAIEAAKKSHKKLQQIHNK